MTAFRADGNGSVRVSLPSLSVNHLRPLWLLRRRAARVKGGGNLNEKGNERRAGTAQKSKQLVSPKDCLQGSAMPTITFLQVHLAPRRKEAPHGPRRGLGDEHGGRGGRGREAEGGRQKEEGEKNRVQIQMSICRHSEESLLADRLIYWILPVNHCRPVAKRISSKAERQPRETGL